MGHVEVQGRQLQVEGELEEEGMQSSIIWFRKERKNTLGPKGGTLPRKCFCGVHVRTKIPRRTCTFARLMCGPGQQSNLLFVSYCSQSLQLAPSLNPGRVFAVFHACHVDLLQRRHLKYHRWRGNHRRPLVTFCPTFMSWFVNIHLVVDIRGHSRHPQVARTVFQI